MSLARATLLALRPQPPSLACAQLRLSSSTAHHHEHHHDDHHESTQFPREGFTSAGWRYTIVGALAVVAFYKYAPAAGEDNFVTRYIAHYYTPKEVWERINNKHLVMTAEMQENAQVIQGAKRPPIHRFRHPQSFERASPYLIPVGQEVDLSDLKVKGDKDF